MLAAALRSHRQFHASAIAACTLLFVAAANIGPTRAAEHTLMPSPQTVHIGYFLASIKPVLSIESGDVVTLQSVASIVPSVVDQAGVVPPSAVPQYHRDIYGEVKPRPWPACLDWADRDQGRDAGRRAGSAHPRHQSRPRLGL
jgi:hypothetical protein